VVVAGGEKREQSRATVDIRAAIVVGTGEPTTGTIGNVSVDGMFVRANVRAGFEAVHLQCVLRPDHEVCEARGKVRWRGPLGVGVHFDEVNDAYLAFVRALAAAAAEPGERRLRELLGRLVFEPNVVFDRP
jgi:PilZ domain